MHGTGCKMQDARFNTQDDFIYCLLSIAYCSLPIFYCLFSTVYNLLPTVYCSLPTAYCLTASLPTTLL